MPGERTVLLFRSKTFDLSWPEEVDPKSGDPWGKDCAEFLSERLPHRGVEVSTPVPYWGEGGWYVDAAVGGATFNLFVHWWPVGSPAKEYWTVSITERRGLWKWLLRRSASDEAWRAIRDAVEAALAERDFEDARWLTSDELQ